MTELSAHQQTVANQLAFDYASVGTRSGGDGSVYLDCYAQHPEVCVSCGRESDAHWKASDGHAFVAPTPVKTYRVGRSGAKQEEAT